MNIIKKLIRRYRRIKEVDLRSQQCLARIVVSSSSWSDAKFERECRRLNRLNRLQATGCAWGKSFPAVGVTRTAELIEIWKDETDKKSKES